MEYIVRNVGEVALHERTVYEALLGHPLRDDQQIVIRVVEPVVEPDETARRAAIADAVAIARKGRASAAAQGVTEEEVDAAIEEAIRHARRRNG